MEGGRRRRFFDFVIVLSFFGGRCSSDLSSDTGLAFEKEGAVHFRLRGLLCFGRSRGSSFSLEVGGGERRLRGWCIQCGAHLRGFLCGRS